jgi:hypothetical protein
MSTSGEAGSRSRSQHSQFGLNSNTRSVSGRRRRAGRRLAGAHQPTPEPAEWIYPDPLVLSDVGYLSYAWTEFTEDDERDDEEQFWFGEGATAAGGHDGNAPCR